MKTTLFGDGTEEPVLNVQLKPKEEESVYSLASIIVHIVAVVAALSDDELFTPFITILAKTAEAKVCYPACSVPILK